MTALVKVSSIDAKAKIEPKIGPIHGVQPKPKATPITYGKRIFLDSFASNLFSKFKYGILIIPINWREKIIITIPAEILNTSEFCNRACPKTDADAPKITNTVENPKQNKINGKKLILFWFKISCNDWPEI